MNAAGRSSGDLWPAEEEIRIPEIVLKWSEWSRWPSLVPNSRSQGGILVPNKQSGAARQLHLPIEDN